MSDIHSAALLYVIKSNELQYCITNIAFIVISHCCLKDLCYIGYRLHNISTTQKTLIRTKSHFITYQYPLFRCISDVLYKLHFYLILTCATSSYVPCTKCTIVACITYFSRVGCAQINIIVGFTFYINSNLMHFIPELACTSFNVKVSFYVTKNILRNQLYFT